MKTKAKTPKAKARPARRMWRGCHLQIQGRVNPHTPYFLEHSEWVQPYVAGFYAKKYLGLDLTREETTARRAELLALERRA